MRQRQFVFPTLHFTCFVLTVRVYGEEPEDCFVRFVDRVGYAGAVRGYARIISVMHAAVLAGVAREHFQRGRSRVFLIIPLRNDYARLCFGERTLFDISLFRVPPAATAFGDLAEGF